MIDDRHMSVTIEELKQIRFGDDNSEKRRQKL